MSVVVVLARVIHLVMALFIGASGVVLVDDSGVLGDQPALESTADAMREVGSGELSGGLDEFDDIRNAVRRIAGSFNDIANALD